LDHHECANASAITRRIAREGHHSHRDAAGDEWGRSERHVRPGEEHIESTDALVVNYEEIRGPTFSATRGGRDIPLEPSLGFRVPVEMRERYDTPSRKSADVVEAVATYSGFRRFDLRTLTQPDPPTGEPGSEATPPVPSR
jgi:hypothetical protein